MVAGGSCAPFPTSHTSDTSRKGRQAILGAALLRRAAPEADWCRMSLLLDPELTFFGGCCCRRLAAGDTVNVRSLQSSGSSGGAAAKQSCSDSAVVGGGES
jgi:hypothetical protein